MDIVLASLQSLAMRDYDDAIFKGFGLVIIDECHHTGAEVFSRALAKVNSAVMMGLSATVKRKDGLTRVFEWHIGKPVYTIRKRDDPDVTIRVLSFYDPDPAYSEEKTMWNGKVNFAATITAIVTYGPRNAAILEALLEAKRAEPGRRVLILSERRGHLDALRALIATHPTLGTTGYYVGGMKEAALKASESADVLLATYAMAAEGMDVPGLDTLVLASPVTAIEQPVGRILRQKPEDRRHIPLVIDVIDGFGMFVGQGKRRLAFYKKQGYKIMGAKGKKALAPPPEDAEADADKPPTKAVYSFIARPDEDGV
jgi:superfamily II DNA or RNA helicase